ncbi:hypothetical protein, partial [Pseudomonas aeruginosa]|uniref:hypothetical protein n=1 Tax=Pseudomonas aeruginosa TaxID=287 RepID=UPI0028FDEDE8
LPSVLSLDKALHWRPPLILNPSNHSKDDANVFTRSGPEAAAQANLRKQGKLTPHPLCCNPAQ